MTKRIIVGKSGAPGAFPGIPAPKAPRTAGVETTIDGFVIPTAGRVLDQFDPDHFDIDTGAANRRGEHVPAIGNA